MSMLLVQDDDEKIVKSRPGMMFGVKGNQGSDPGENLMDVGEAHVNGLPDPSLGGQNASGFINGFSMGIRSLFSRTQPFMGQMATAPVITNPIQGEVGQSNRADRLYAGVMNQFVQYTPSLGQYAPSYVGLLPEKLQVTK
ncbi:hypothetical protein SEA_SCOUPSA_20 [Microbacterium phage SCoupsA]|nr:hypothetical protein SEA_SCOUPSA_20 [Microbacterium phage SCoupsA]